jgi:hypothetical protein
VVVARDVVGSVAGRGDDDTEAVQRREYGEIRFQLAYLSADSSTTR